MSIKKWIPAIICGIGAAICVEKLGFFTFVGIMLIILGTGLGIIFYQDEL